MHNRDITVNVGSVAGKFGGQLSIAAVKFMGNKSVQIYASDPQDLRLRGIIMHLNQSEIDALKRLIAEAEQAMRELP
ncbi:hypothetical protein ABTW95_34760 [Spirillospora sp. NPDC127506]